MGLILNIDTATENAMLSIADNGVMIEYIENNQPKSHASFLHTGIQKLLKKTNVNLQDLSAIAVVNGPGSYTGIRVGMASTKGLCFALNKPLITIDSLIVMAHAALQNSDNKDYLFCPLLDARRMEVFFALYNSNLDIIVKPQAVILDEKFLKDILDTYKIIFFGTGAFKWQQICKHGNAYFKKIIIPSSSMSFLSNRYLINNKFSDIFYVEPLYLKEFYVPHNT